MRRRVRSFVIEDFHRNAVQIFMEEIVALTQNGQSLKKPPNGDWANEIGRQQIAQTHFWYNSYFSPPIMK